MPKQINITVPTTDDVKDFAQDKVEDVQETVEDVATSVENKVNALSTAKKVVLLGSAFVVTYSVVSAVVRRIISPKQEVIEGEVIVVTAQDIENRNTDES